MIVLDCSALVDVLVGDPVNTETLTVMAENDLHAPDLLDYEVVSALRGHCLAGKLSRVRVEEAIEAFTALTIERHSMTRSLGYMIGLRDNFTIYDAAYVVLAEALEAPLVTADRKMLDARRLGVSVHLIVA